MNADECLLTRMQEITMDYHFGVEQEVGSAIHAFFSFNGNLGFFDSMGQKLINPFFIFFVTFFTPFGL